MDFQTNSSVAQIEQSLLEHYGPMIEGQTLARALGFPSANALRQARRCGRLGVRTFRISGRRGIFALTADIAQWMSQQAGRETK